MADIDSYLPDSDRADGASGAAVPDRITQVGGKDNSNLLQPISLDSSARLIIAPLTNTSVVKAQLQDNGGTGITLGQKPMSSSLPVVISADYTYSAAASGLVTGLLATDIFTVSGSASKTIIITEVSISGTSTAGSGASVNCSMIKRSTADTGGTSTTLTNVPYDSSSPSSTAVVKSYTANPTLGSTVGAVRAFRLDFAITGASQSPVIQRFGTKQTQGIILRGAAEQLCINFGSTSITGPSISISVEWVEI